GVEEDIDGAALVADDDDAVLADVGEEEVAGVRHLALVGHEVPGAGEDALELNLVDLLLREDAPVDGALFGINQPEEVGRALQFERHQYLLRMRSCVAISRITTQTNEGAAANVPRPRRRLYLGRGRFAPTAMMARGPRPHTFP